MSLNIQISEHEAKARVDQSILDEVGGCIYHAVEGFFEKYFEKKSWSPLVEQIVRASTPKPPLSSLFKLALESTGGRSVFQDRLPGSCGETAPSHLFLVPHGTSEYSWANIQVVGQFQEGTRNHYHRGFLRLYEHAREVFINQPTRLFLHGFYVFGSMIELWMFDRSGLYSCEPINVDADLGRFITIVASYQRMSDSELGINSFIKQDGLGSYITFDGAERFYLEAGVAAPRYIVGPGTTCYASRKNLVIKFAWREDKRHTELELLTLIKERNVWGVIRVLGCQDIENIGSLRRDLQFIQPYDKTADLNSGQDTSFNENAESFINRTFSCILTSPLGRSINKFESILEFLEACRDVIKALRSLYQDGKILHRDICIKNLIIVSLHNEGYAKGALIDLDGSLDLAKGPARKGELVGSEGFMAIGILTGNLHTYRHDLESLLYVFLWVAICNDHDHDDQESLRNQPKTSRLWGWCSTDFRSVARNKIFDMQPDGFLGILGEFSVEFKHLKGVAGELKELLFPLRGEVIFTGTDTDQDSINRLYDGMINVFNRSITSQAYKETL